MQAQQKGLQIPTVSKATKWLVTCAVITNFFAFPVGTHASVPTQLQEAVASITIAGSADWSRHQQISNGYLVSFTANTPNHNDITLTSLSTSEEFNISLVINGQLPIVTSATVVAKNRVALTGILLNDHVTAGGIASSSKVGYPFLAYTDFDGQVSSITDLGTFSPYAVCATGDGETWLLGQDMAKEGGFYLSGGDMSKVSAAYDYDLVRGYTPQGKFYRSALKRRALPVSSDMFFSLAATSAATISCSSQTIGVYVGRPMTSETSTASSPLWSEIDRRTLAIQTWHIDAEPINAKLSGLSYPNVNSVYASFASHEKTGVMAALYSLALSSNGNGKWMATNVARASSPNSVVPHLKMLGADGADVVYVNGLSTAQPASPVVVWSPVNQTEITSAPLEIAPAKTASSPPTLTTDGGNVQRAVDLADAILDYLAALTVDLPKYTKYTSACWTTACINARTSLTNSVAQWKATKDKKTRTLAFAVTTKANIYAAESSLNNAIKAQTAASQPVKSGGGGGGGGGGCGVLQAPEDPNPDKVTPRCFIKYDDPVTPSADRYNALQRAVARDSYPARGFLETAFQQRSEFQILTSVSPCDHTCNTESVAAFAVCSITFGAVIAGEIGFTAGLAAPLAFWSTVAAGIGCLTVQTWTYQTCEDNCSADTTCPSSEKGNYDAFFQGWRRTPFRRERVPFEPDANRVVRFDRT